MKLSLRRMMVAGAVLLGLALLVWQRLDLADFDAYIQQQTNKLADTKVSIAGSKLSFLHGVGLRLDKVMLTHPQFRMQAEHIDVSVNLLPLLLGKIEIARMAVHRGTFTVPPSLLLRTSAKGLAFLPTERIQLVRCQLITDTGREVLKNIHLDLRDIGINRETLWEIQAQKDEQSLRGHGRLDFRGGEIDKGFGKLKLNDVSVIGLLPFAPDSLSGWFDNPDNLLSGTLTLDITGRHAWSVFGEMALKASNYDAPLRLRGKINHPDDNQYEWHDSFIHFDDKKVISIQGECLESKCQTDIQAKSIPFSTWLPLLPKGFKNMSSLRARSDISTHIQWLPSSWQASAEMQLRKASYERSGHQITLPDIDFQQATAKGSRGLWQIAGQALFKSNDQLTFKIVNHKAETNVFVQSQRLHTVWPSFANLLLAAWDFTPALKGNGDISGSIEIDLSKSGKSLKLDMDASQASIQHPQFSKPASAAASCQATIQWQGHNDLPSSAELNHCQLHTAKVQELHWQSNKKDGYRLRSKGLSINFDALQKEQVKLPDMLRPFQGSLNADFDTSWSPKDTTPWPWMTQAAGKLNLQELGTRFWKASGLMQAEHGVVRSSHLYIQGIHGNTDLNGNFDFSDQRGRIDILTANLDWNDMPSLDQTWDQLHLSGRIRQGHAKLLDNLWQDIQGQYDFHQGGITIDNFKAALARGTVSSPKLRLQPVNSGLQIKGKIRAKNLKLSEIDGLDSWLKAGVKGRLHANLKLSGQLPASRLENWKGSNGDVLVYSGQWSKLGEASTLTEKLGLSTPPAQLHDFKKLETRFRISSQRVILPSIRLQLGNKLLKGQGRIGEDMAIRGSISDNNDSKEYRLGGHWPIPNWEMKKTP